MEYIPGGIIGGSPFTTSCNCWNGESQAENGNRPVETSNWKLKAMYCCTFAVKSNKINLLSLRIY